MNLHLFLTVMAWVWGILCTITLLYFAMKRTKIEWGSAQAKVWGISLLVATLCWAWIIAG